MSTFFLQISFLNCYLTINFFSDAKILVDGAIGQSSAITNGGDKVIVFGGFTGATAGNPNYDLYE